MAQELDLELFLAFGGWQVDGDALKTDNWTRFACAPTPGATAASRRPVLLLVDRAGFTDCDSDDGRDSTYV